MIKKILLALSSIKNLHILFLDYFGLKKGDVVYTLWNGTKFIARAGSTDYSEIIINNADSEYPSKYFPKTQSPIILDLGANIGESAIFIYKKLFENNPIIVAIEPNSENFKYLKKNIKLNNINCITPYKLAITGNTGKSNLNFNKRHFDGGFIGNINSRKMSNSEKVLTMTLEDFCSKYNIPRIDLLKIDIEGCEYEVFDASLKFIKKYVQSIFIELHDLDKNRNYSAFKTYIVKNNFTIVTEIMNRTVFLRNKSL